MPKLTLGHEIPNESDFASLGRVKSAFVKYFRDKYPNDQRGSAHPLDALKALREHTAEEIARAGGSPHDYYSQKTAREIALFTPQRLPGAASGKTAAATPKNTEAGLKRKLKLTVGENIPKESELAAGETTRAFVKYFRDKHPTDGRVSGANYRVKLRALREHTAEEIARVGENPRDYYSPETAREIARFIPQRSSGASRGNIRVRLTRMVKRRLSESPLTQYSIDPFAYILNPERK